MVRVTDEESFLTARRLAREEGILAGGSSGTALAAALKFAQRLDQPKYIVVLLPDTGRNYIDKIYSDRWMMENGFLRAEPREGGRTSRTSWSRKKGLPPLICVSPKDNLICAISRMQEYNISQLPVIEDNKIVGSINEAVGHEAAARRRELRGTEGRGGHGQAPADAGRATRTSPRPSGCCSPGPPASWSCGTARRWESSPGRIW